MKQIILLTALALSPLVHANPEPTTAAAVVSANPVTPGNAVAVTNPPAAINTVAAAKAAEEQAALFKLAKEVQAQQVTMAENQAKIDARLTAVAEAIRVARIYTSRSGN